MRSSFFGILFLIICLPNYSQIINGTVFNNETGKPVPYANVFFNGTTIGTYTDIYGYFKLILPKDLRYPIAISFIGYESLLISDYPVDKSIKVFLKPKIYKLDEVTVKSKMTFSERMDRKYYLSLFRKEFFGESLNTGQCKIMNEDDIVLQYFNETGMLKAYSNKPLIIINEALGYQIVYYIDIFDCSQAELNLYGFYTFKEDNTLEGRKKVVAEKRRRLAYIGSRMHFIRSLWSNVLDSAGFTIKNKDNNILTYDSLVVQTGSHTKYLKRKGTADIAYLSKRTDTQIEILNDSVYFNKSGYIDPYVINWAGEMSKQRIAELLPFDYIYQETTAGRDISH